MGDLYHAAGTESGRNRLWRAGTAEGAGHPIIQRLRPARAAHASASIGWRAPSAAPALNAPESLSFARDGSGAVDSAVEAAGAGGVGVLVGAARGGGPEVCTGGERSVGEHLR